MTLDEYIAELEQIRAAHGGGLQVQTTDYRFSRVTATMPRIGYVRVLRGRETTARFWSSIDGADRQGEKVVRI